MISSKPPKILVRTSNGTYQIADVIVAPVVPLGDGRYELADLLQELGIEVSEAEQAIVIELKE